MTTLVHGGPGTTANIEEIFIGRCYQYQEITANKIITPSSVNCPFLWNTFQSAFAYKDPAAIERSDYQPFFDLAEQMIPDNKTVLWSGTYDIAHKYAADGTRYVTMEDSLIGYLANGLNWCGTEDHEEGDGINYVECPDWQDLPEQASQAFWGGASATFAGNSKGEIKLVLTGSNPTRKAYTRTSFFSNFELPNINVDEATVSVVLVNDVGQPALEHCDTGSLILLREDLTDRGLEFHCEENPRDFLHLMCVDDPTAWECRFFCDVFDGSVIFPVMHVGRCKRRG